MIKRRFYRVEHGERDGDGYSSSSSSSSSSDSEAEAQISEADSDTEPQPQPASDAEPDDDSENDNNDNDDNESASLKPQSPSSSSSGYESEDSSLNEIDAEDSPGLLTIDDDDRTERDEEKLNDSLLSRKEKSKMEKTLATDQPVAEDIPSCVLKCKSIFKCRLCPKIVCLNEESLKAHLESKRHARSEKLLKDGRLKRFLNSDGEEEVFSDDDGETHAERHARIVALAQTPLQSMPSKSKGRQRQRERLKRKKQNKSSDKQNSGQQKENRAKRRRKNADKKV